MNNTGNPVGSKAFLDFEDNVEILDKRLTSDEPVVNDRLGNPHLSWAGIEKAGSGDPGVIVPIVQQAVQDVVAGVDGQVAVAQSAADRAEAASDAAFVNADVYPDIATGRAAVADGEQFQVASADGLELIRYKRDSAATQTEVARIPAGSIMRDLKARADLVDVSGVSEAVSRPNAIAPRQSASLEMPVVMAGSAQSTTLNGKQVIHLTSTTGNDLRVRWNVPANVVAVGEAFTASIIVESASIGNTSEVRVLQLGTSTTPVQTDVARINGPSGSVSDTLVVQVTAVRHPDAWRYLTIEINAPKGTAHPQRSLYVHSPAIWPGADTAYRPSIERSIDGARLLESSVAERHCSFIQRSANLFDFRAALPRAAIVAGTGEVEADNQSTASDYIPVEPGTNYAASVACRWFEYDAEKNPIETSSPSIVNTIKAGPYTRFIRVASREIDGAFMLNEGVESLAYEPYSRSLDSDLLPVPPLSVPAVHGRNLFNKETALVGWGLDAFGVPVEREDRTLSDFIRLDAGETLIYLISQYVIVIAFYERSGAVILRTTLSAQTQTIEAPEGTHGFRFHFSTPVIDYMMIQKSDNWMVSYEPFGHREDRTKVLPYPTLASVVVPTPSIETGYYLTGDNVPLSDILGEGAVVDLVYARYQALVDAFPEYVEKTILGRDQSDTYDIWQLRFSLGQVAGEYTRKLPTILLTFGIHGHEHPSVTAPLALLWDLCHNWKSSPLLRWLRFNCQIVVIPITNPWGISNSSRKNSRGVDINRNFVPYHDPVGPESASTYGGPYPLSEAEARIVDGFLSEHRDAVAYFDCHSMTAGPSDQLLWFPIPALNGADPMIDMIARQVITDATASYQINYGSPKLDWHGYISSTPAAGTKMQGSVVYGVPSTTFEVSREATFISDPILLLKQQVENFGNLLLTTLRAYIMYSKF